MLKLIKLSGIIRFYSIKRVPKSPLKYTETINLPKTNFPHRLTATKRSELEQRLLSRVFEDVYNYQLVYNKEPAYVLHDGPPYANGDIHMGHAINKILKDITIRNHCIEGQKVQYKPGWDCHGLPIELKASTESINKDVDNVKDASSIREKCRAFALEAIETQKKDFRSLGIVSDFENDENMYKTIDPNVIVNQLNLFKNLYKCSLIFRALKPVYWSPSSRTALAESELEYNEQFISPSVYIRFRLNRLPLEVSEKMKVYALVWTTTPWTLLSNQAICYNKSLEYSLVELENGDANTYYLIATNLLNDFQQTTNIKYSVKQRIPGSNLLIATYTHPIYSEEKNLQFFDAPHVKDTKGTGLVHTAPAHGPDDFLVGLKERIAVKSFVNEEGTYTLDAPEFLRGKYVLDEGNRLILDHLTQDIVFSSKLVHSYPIDWRTKQPVIIRASDQWFLATESLKTQAVIAINELKIYPKVNADASKKALITQVLKRPYWCISRQRVWGIPIPVFYVKHSNQVITSPEIVEHICHLVETSGGVDFWWKDSVEEILPNTLLKEFNVTADQLVKGDDIFDIWFDSGSTWTSVLENNKIADLYLEGHDQFNGWFQSSLLTSIAARKCAPYKALFIHGFAVDSNGLKMSKSLGNVISPKEIIKKYGADVIRWWVASHATQNTSITVSHNLLTQTSDDLNKIRNILRYLNGVIGAKHKEDENNLKSSSQIYLNKFLLSTLVTFEKEIQNHYTNFEYNRVVSVVQNFIANDISGIYVNLIKDRLYCGDDNDLQNICYTLSQCYEILCKAIWPIAPFLIEESWSFYDIKGTGFHKQHVKADPAWYNCQSESVIKTALDIKRLINQSGLNVNTWSLDAKILISNEEKLNQLLLLQKEINMPVSNSELCELLQVSSVELCPIVSEKLPDDMICKVTVNNKILCPRCRRFAVDDGTSTCERCTDILKIKNFIFDK